MLGNLLWFILGGLVSGLAWILVGMLWCVTILGIPIGIQCFKFAKLAFFPFGKEIVYGGGGFSFIVNIIWILISGLEMSIVYLLAGIVFCVTIIGIPFGKQFFKLARLSLLPFGAEVRKINS